MASRIGADLHRARTRREIELGEVEAATRIRIRFLRAIEAEEWEVLPGGVYTRGFIRTYASFLGMDGERLVDDYRREVEGVPAGRGPAPDLAPLAASTATGSPGGRRSVSYLGWLVVPAVLLVAAVAIVALPDGGGQDNPVRAPAETNHQGAARKPTPAKAPKPAGGIELRLTAGAEVWVCLLDSGGRPLVEGQILEAGAEEGPFRSGSFTVSLGNGEVSMLIDGRQAEIPASSSPVGYAIDSAGDLEELSETERPTCT
jgi:cytoskeleton protein RodZ